MCGRATLLKPIKVIEERYQAKLEFPEDASKVIMPNYNIAPTHLHPVLTNEDRDHLQFFRWGLIPFWAKDQKIGGRLINARIETVLEKPAFRSINKRRCLVPFDGFYEWKKVDKKKLPYRIILKEEKLFSIAGIWSSWKNPAGQKVYSFTLLTQPANPLVAQLHDRMPAILLPEQEVAWLDMDLPAKEVVEMIHPYPADDMQLYPVSIRVNKVKENDASLVEEVNVE